MKETNVGAKENKSRMNEINDCMKEISSMQKMRATTPQVLTIVLILMKIDKSNVNRHITWKFNQTSPGFHLSLSVIHS